MSPRDKWQQLAQIVADIDVVYPRAISYGTITIAIINPDLPPAMFDSRGDGHWETLQPSKKRRKQQ